MCTDVEVLKAYPKNAKMLLVLIYLKKAHFVRRGCLLLVAGGRDRTGHQTMTKSDAITVRPWIL
jgi:hypothetical protein